MTDEERTLARAALVRICDTAMDADAESGEKIRLIYITASCALARLTMRVKEAAK